MDFILNDAAYEIRLIEKQTAEIIRLTEEHLARKAYENRIRQPRSLLSIAGQVGPTQINAVINNDLVGQFGMYIDVLERSGHYPLPVNILPRMAWHDSVKYFILLIERMNQWNETCHLEALQMRPGMGLVTPFWRHTSIIMHAWGATRIIAWMRYRELYQPGEFKFPTGPVHRHHLFLQKRYKESYNNAAPFLTLQKPSVISNRTKDNKGFGDLIIVPNEHYMPYHWN